jgi:TolB-like protein/class 3 adenylate cyclase
MQGLAPSETFLFADFRLERRGGLFRRDETGAFVPVAIGSRALDILGVLIARAGEVVSKEDIITAVWPETVVEDSNLTVQISALRRLLDHDRSNGSCIQTVSGRGYRFIAPVARPNTEVLPASPEPGSGSEERQRGFPSAPGAVGSTRRLAAILALDMAGYSRLMGGDEEGTHERLKAHQRELVEPKIREHRGRILNTPGDGMLAEFPSVVDAVRCAAEVQRGMIDRELELPDERRTKVRIGINLGDVIAEGGDIFGDGVNIAARLEALAEPGGICISRVVRDQVRDRLDFAFDDLGDQQVKNLARRVRVYRVRDGALAVEKSMDLLTPPPLPDRPSIAVLPFANMSGDPEQEYFADGMVEEITTALSRIRWLFVIARNSSFTYKAQAIDVKQVGRELGVRYVLEGSVRKAGSRVRIAAQLIEAHSGRHIWADRFDGSLEDVFDLQDKVASSVAGVIEPALQSAETARLVARPTSDLTAYDLYLRAHAKHLSAGTQSGEALHLLEQAIRRDPQYGPALALAAVCHSALYMGGRSEDPEANKRNAAAFARRALVVAGDDPSILANAAYALAYIGEDLGAMMALIDRVLALNPSFARGWYISGWLRLWAGQPDIAIEHAEKSLRLSPRERVGLTQFVIGAAHFYSRRFEEALPKFLLTMQEDPSTPDVYRALAACYAHMGRIDEAREVIARLRTITPSVIPKLSRLSNPEHRELYLSGLRLAAGEETST